MSDKPVKFYTDDLGIIHGPECPVTKAAWAKKGAPEPAKSGPAQVATDAYRDGWARVFGGEPTVGQA